MTQGQRLEPRQRRDEILRTAVDIAKAQGFQMLTREMVAAAAGISPGLVNVYFGTVKLLKDHVMQYAVDQGVDEIIAVGLAMKDPVALSAPKKTKERAVKLMIK